MENEVISTKCKNCGSELVFDPKTRCLKCKHCDSNYFLPSKNEDAVLVRQYSENFHPNQLCQFLKAYKCSACGNVYYMSSDEKSKKCMNCGNSSSTLIEDDGYSADGIIPFKITKEEATKKFREYLRTHFNIPRDLKKLAANGKLMGVFVPVWNFSFNVSATYSANATERRKDSGGADYSISKPVFGDKIQRVKSYDETATSTQDDVLLELFDEDDYADIIPFVPEYTYGYRVDSANKDIHEYYYDITKKAEQKMESKIKKEILSKYKEVSDIDVEAKAEDVFFNFTYVPVYVNTFEYKGKYYKTYVSGTTGKVVGNPPTSFLKKVGTFFKFVALVGLVALIAWLFMK